VRNDWRVLIVGWLVLAIAGVPAAHATESVDLELVLAVDISGSIDPEEARLQRQGYVAAFRHPDVKKAIASGYNGKIAVTYFEWAGAGWQRPVVGWTTIASAAEADGFADRLAAAPVGTGPYTSLSGAIEFAVPLFERSGVKGVRRIIDISGDGENNSGPPVEPVRDAAVAMGFTINGLPIVNDRPTRIGGMLPLPHLDRYYEKCVIGGRGAFLIVANDFASFADAIRRKLILEIADLAPAPGETRAAQAAASLLHLAQGSSAPLPDYLDCNIGYRRMIDFYRQRG
jgi:hypothetical protein